MPDNTKRRQPEDPRFVNVHQDWEVRYWTKKFDVTRKQLQDAVDLVGPGVQKVKKHLGK